MDRQLLRPENAAFFPGWDLEDVRNTFFKCIRWQVEETLDPLSCPYHYYCDSNYPGNYPPTVDVLVLIFATTSYLATLVLMVIDISRRGRISTGQSKRYLLPSGPVSLPIFLLMLAKGHRINTIFPLSCIGPAILQLLYISALTFNNELANEDVKYALFEASTISGILHASVYLDSVILPYYTGFDALVSSRFSGECVSCVCRKEALVVGGKLVTYRGCSVTTFLVASALCLRIISRLSENYRGKITVIKFILESLGWILVTKDSVYLVISSPPEQYVLRICAFGCIFVLICLHLLKQACNQVIQLHSNHEK
ncbi:uncharacterized protein LOC123215375 [Mangifera indica]|uniref:uncharacterized protein LOC123215375 n=1 Tax=Mangifera indica TaxID=29780 RepID=UPI001CFBB06A|nr:uncharacterized protein LOC123215375 [Mangifera indica]